MSEPVLPPVSWDCDYRTGLPLSGSCETPASIGAATPADVVAAQSAAEADATAKVSAHNTDPAAHGLDIPALAKVGQAGGQPTWDGGAWPGGGGGGSTYLEVDTHAALPIDLGAPAVGTIYVVRQSTGLWLVNRKAAGLWRRFANNGTLDDWTRLGDFADLGRDDNLVLVDNADATKRARFEVGGVAAGQTRVLTVPDKDCTLIDAADAVDRANHTGTQGATTITQDANYRFVTDAEKTAWNAKETTAGAQGKADAAQAAAILAAASDATTKANAAQAEAVQRANHTGTQAATTITEDATHRFVTDDEKAAWNAGGGGGMANPMTTAGDLIVGGAAGAPARLGIGSLGRAPVVATDGSLAYELPGFALDVFSAWRSVDTDGVGASSGTGASADTNPNTDTGDVRTLLASTGTTATGSAALFTHGAWTAGRGQINFGCDWDLRAELRLVDAVSDGTDGYRVYFGAIGNAYTAPTDACGIIIDEANVLKLFSMNNGVSTEGSVTLAPVSGTRYKLRVYFDSTARVVYGWVNGVSLGSVSTNIPDVADGSKLGARILKTAGTTSRGIRINGAFHLAMWKP